MKLSYRNPQVSYLQFSKDQFTKDVNKANKAKTDEEHDRLNRKADEKLSEAVSAKTQYTRSNKQQLLKNAREKDSFDMDFLEVTGDNWSTQKTLSEYSKYLDDPEKYMRTSH